MGNGLSRAHGWKALEPKPCEGSGRAGSSVGSACAIPIFGPPRYFITHLVAVDWNSMTIRAYSMYRVIHSVRQRLLLTLYYILNVNVSQLIITLYVLIVV